MIGELSVRLITLVIIFSSLSYAASAQTLRQQPSDADRITALTGKLQDELNTEMELRTMIVQSQHQMADLQREIAALKAKCGKACEDEKK